MTGLLLLIGAAAWVIAQTVFAVMARRPPTDLSDTLAKGPARGTRPPGWVSIKRFGSGTGLR
ncbi:hypothetical protein, partial [Micromonospora sp. I033]